jgi:hypothetical protein
VGHVTGGSVTLVSLETGKSVMLEVNASIPIAGEGRMPFLMGLAFGERYSREILRAYVIHAAIQLLNQGEGTEGLAFNTQGDLEDDGEWWYPDMDNCEFGTASGSVRRGDQVLIDFSKGMPPDKEWVAFTPETYYQWWRLVDEKHHITELLSFESR